MTKVAVGLQDVREALERIAEFVHRTPTVTNRTFDDWAGKELFFKCENLQKIGAFKYRGACNAILQLPPEDAQRGVLTHSSGNHAQAISLAAKSANIPAYIVMPKTAPAVKRRAVEQYGGQVFECEPILESREATTAKVAEETGAVFIPPYNHPHIIAGQGTAALELIEEVPDLDAVIAPIGGGGLISGTCAALCCGSSPIRVFGAEPQRADDAARSKAANSLLPSTNPQTIADGLLTSLGDLTWPYVRDHVESIITVSEEEIVSTMRRFWERTKLLIEPSSAVTIAATLTEEFKSNSEIRRVGVIISGGNVDLERLPWLS